MSLCKLPFANLMKVVLQRRESYVKFIYPEGRSSLGEWYKKRNSSVRYSRRVCFRTHIVRLGKYVYTHERGHYILIAALRGTREKYGEKVALHGVTNSYVISYVYECHIEITTSTCRGLVVSRVTNERVNSYFFNCSRVFCSQAIYDMLGACSSNRPADSAEERAKNIFAKMDENNDGQLTQDEFLKGCLQDEELSKMLAP